MNVIILLLFVCRRPSGLLENQHPCVLCRGVGGGGWHLFTLILFCEASSHWGVSLPAMELVSPISFALCPLGKPRALPCCQACT